MSCFTVARQLENVRIDKRKMGGSLSMNYETTSAQAPVILNEGLTGRSRTQCLFAALLPDKSWMTNAASESHFKNGDPQPQARPIFYSHCPFAGNNHSSIASSQ